MFYLDHWGAIHSRGLCERKIPLYDGIFGRDKRGREDDCRDQSPWQEKDHRVSVRTICAHILGISITASAIIERSRRGIHIHMERRWDKFFTNVCAKCRDNGKNPTRL